MSNSFVLNHQELQSGALELGVKLNEQQLMQFERYGELLYKKNEVLNLTRIPPTEFVQRQILDSLTIVPELGSDPWQGSIIDLGTGAGIPGIPLAIALPQAKFTLLDSVAKKINFVTEVIQDLQLVNTRALQARAEVLGRDSKFRDQFDVAVARACAPLALLLELGIPLCKLGGRLIALKGPAVEDELIEAKAALDQLRCARPQVKSANLQPGRDSRLVVVEKKRLTPNTYPRNSMAISKGPISK